MFALQKRFAQSRLIIQGQKVADNMHSGVQIDNLVAGQRVEAFLYANLRAIRTPLTLKGSCRHTNDISSYF